MKQWTESIYTVAHHVSRRLARAGIVAVPALLLGSGPASAQSQLVYYNPISVYTNSQYVTCSTPSGTFRQDFIYFGQDPAATELFAQAVSGPVHASAVLSAPDIAVALADAGGASSGPCGAGGSATAVVTGQANVYDPQGRSSVKLAARIRAAAVTSGAGVLDPQARYDVRIASALDEPPFFTLDPNGNFLSIFMPQLFNSAVFWVTANVNTTNDPNGIGTTQVCDSVAGCTTLNGFSNALETTVEFEGPPGALYVEFLSLIHI